MPGLMALRYNPPWPLVMGTWSFTPIVTGAGNPASRRADRRSTQGGRGSRI